MKQSILIISVIMLVLLISSCSSDKKDSFCCNQGLRLDSIENIINDSLIFSQIDCIEPFSCSNYFASLQSVKAYRNVVDSFYQYTIKILDENKVPTNYIIKGQLELIDTVRLGMNNQRVLHPFPPDYLIYYLTEDWQTFYSFEEPFPKNNRAIYEAFIAKMSKANTQMWVELNLILEDATDILFEYGDDAYLLISFDHHEAELIGMMYWNNGWKVKYAH